MDEYGIIFVGFPIWWYVAPTIINTFLESYNLKGKTIIPFATSGGSGMGKINENLAPSCPGAKLLHGKVFSSYSSKADLSAWRTYALVSVYGGGDTAAQMRLPFSD